MNKDLIINILKNGNQAYSDGKEYALSLSDKSIICEFLECDAVIDTLTDSLYDMIYKKAKQTWQNDSFFNELCAEDLGYGKEIVHSEPMGSMEELKEGDWDKWKKGHRQFLISDKLDGCSIILTYKQGKLFSAATRGRGVKGKCIMRHISQVTNIPHTINYTKDIVIRGELLCPKDNISTMLMEVEQQEGKAQKNGRNTIAGALNRKETNISVFKYAKFIAYWDSNSRGNAFDNLKTLGFDIPHTCIIQAATTEAELVDIVIDRLANSEFELDGIILTQLDNVEEGLETGTINPKASRKFKIGIYNNIAESVVVGITWQISKNCKLTPVLHIEPIELCGSTISNVTGHNYQNLIDKQCGIGSKVKIKRAGLVIPYLEEVLTSSSDLNLPTDYYVKGVDIYSNTNTQEVYVQKLVHFAKVFDLEQAGQASMEKLLQYNPLYENPVFLFALQEDDAKFVLGINGSKLYNSIKKVFDEGISEAKLGDACGCFGEGFGENLLTRIELKYGELIPLQEEIEDFGPARLKQYNENFLWWLDTLSVYKSLGGKFKASIKKEGKLSNAIICFTGIRDKVLKAKLEEQGATVTDTFTKNVTVLITKDANSTSSKIQKAKENGVKIITVEEGYALI